MSAPESLYEAERDGWSDEFLVQCERCGEDCYAIDLRLDHDGYAVCVECAEVGGRDA